MNQEGGIASPHKTNPKRNFINKEYVPIGQS